MGTPHDRVHARFKTDLAVTMKWRRSVVSVHATDASEGGVFVPTDEQPALRELVRLDLTIPGRADVLSVHGMPVNSARANDPEGRAPGVGIQFYAMDRDAQRVWGQFIEHLRRTQEPLPKFSPAGPRAPLVLPEGPVPHGAAAPAQKKTPTPAAPTRPVAPAQTKAAPVAPVAPTAPVAPVAPVAAAPLSRPGERQAIYAAEEVDEEAPSEAVATASLELEIASEEDLYEFYMRDVAAGGMFILSDVTLPEGERITLFIRHPIANDSFELEAVVRSASEGPDGPGLEVDFVDLDEQRLDALREFIECDGAPPNTFDALEAAAASAEAANADAAPPEDWQAPITPDPKQGQLAQLFDPWTGSTPDRPWSKPPPEDEFDSIFEALSPGDSGIHRSAPAPAVHEVPDFLMAIPSWTSIDVSVLDPGQRLSIELDTSDLVEVREDRLHASKRTADEAAPAPRRPAPRVR
ncbi:MAG: PilZ domain-containing protein [Polyangiales bacterium]